MEKSKKTDFNFEITLSVLEHLGRNLYRSFITVIGEAISNSWDADADNVWITIDPKNNYFVIKDDGLGMSENNFRTRFLKIGYSKRQDNNFKSKKGRPFIGRKGIGKLALLSCAEKISIMTKMKETDYIGGVIDNSGLDKAIKDDVPAQEYTLGTADDQMFAEYQKEHAQGTIIYFENINEGIRNKLENIKRSIALAFKFSLIDSSFNIFVNDEKITENQLEPLAEKSQFLWSINEFKDPYISILKALKNRGKITSSLAVKGFISSVEKPSHLKIRTADEKIGIDLFVNGRLREKNILGYFSDFSTRVIASYLYGQIHLDVLDNGKGDDRFTSSREGIKEGDVEYEKLLSELKFILVKISKQWDVWRLAIQEDGDIDNPRITPKERKAKSLVNEVSKEFTLPKGSLINDEVDTWIKSLRDDAQFNVSAYIDCFMSENLLREYIHHKSIALSNEANKEAERLKNLERKNKDTGNISIDIMQNVSDRSYLSMDDLANLLDKDPHKASLSRDAKEYKPMRNAVAHTAKLTPLAKDKLTSVYKNIKARILTLLSQ